MAAKKGERVTVFWVDDNYWDGPVRVHCVAGTVTGKTILLDERCRGYQFRKRVARDHALLTAADAVAQWRGTLEGRIAEAEHELACWRKLLKTRPMHLRPLRSPRA